MDEIIILALAVVAAVASVGGYAVKRNFDENQAYIAHGYHQTAQVEQAWAKE